MKLSNHSIVMMLLGVVVLAGCVGQPTAPSAGSAGTAGIVVSGLQASPPQVYTDSSMVISANLKNIGQATPSPDPTVQLFGLESWRGDCAVGSKNNPQTVLGLVKADPAIGQQGGQSTVVWSCTAPSSSTISTVISYPFIMRTTYEYTTTFNGVMKAVTSDYFRQTNQQGGIVSQAFTSGPLTISVQVPSVIAPSPNVPILFTVTNSGGGRVCNVASCTGADLDKLTYAPITNDANPLTCPSVSTAVLGGGTTTVISCTVDASKVSSFANINLGLKLTYYYYVDAAQTVTVLPIAGATTTTKGTTGVTCSVDSDCQSGKCDPSTHKCT